MTSIKHATYTSGILRLTMTDGRVYELDHDDAELIIETIDATDKELNQ